MSRRSILQKKRNRIAKALRLSPPVYIDLIGWLRDRGYAQTAGEARKLIKDGRVMHESHALGQSQVYSVPAELSERGVRPGGLRGFPTVPAHLRDGIFVKPESDG